VCHGAEIIITDRNKYRSIATGMEIINMIKEKYPNQFKLKTSGINRLWGNAEFSEQIASDNTNQFNIPLEKYKNTSKQYWIYE
jgi:uncharacterized protein YbbC (DUF1343 family)